MHENVAAKFAAPPQSAAARLLVVSAIVAAVPAQSWRQDQPTASPPPRTAAAMAALPAGDVVVFGGVAGTATWLGDTWRYDGTTWTQVGGTGPIARARSAMAAFAAGGSVVLFGGNNGVGTANYLGDTWEFAGSWQQRATVNHPAPRFGHAMAGDPLRQRVVMFGGRTRAGTIFLADTWEWDGVDWLPRAPLHAPTARMDHAMAFDPQGGRVLLFGGIQLGGPIVGDSWSFDGSDWTLLAPVHAPSPRMQAALATDPQRRRVVLQGGYDGVDLVDTFEWNGSDWLQQPAAALPGVTALAAAATGPGDRRVVLFGGQDGAGADRADTFTRSLFAAVRQLGVGCGVAPLQLGAVGGSTPALGAAFTSAMAPVPTGALPFQSIGFSASDWHGTPLPLDLGPLQMPGCWLYHDAAWLFLPVALSGDTATHTLAIPDVAAFLGVEIYLQGTVFGVADNAAGLITSNALGLRLGEP